MPRPDPGSLLQLKVVRTKTDEERGFPRETPHVSLRQRFWLPFMCQAKEDSYEVPVGGELKSSLSEA